MSFRESDRSRPGGHATGACAPLAQDEKQCMISCHPLEGFTMRIISGGLAIVAVITGLVAAPSPARAENSAKWFLDQIDGGNTVALVVLDGYANGMSWANTDLKLRGLPPLFCEPDRLAITAQQNADILRRYVDGAGAALAEDPAGLVLLYALKDTFPCDNSLDRSEQGL